MPNDPRATKLFDGYTPIGSPGFGLDILLSMDGGRLKADDGPTLALTNQNSINDFTFRPGKHVWVLLRLLIIIDFSPKKVNYNTYGDAELTLGAILSIKNSDGSVKYRFNPKPLTRILDWALLAGVDLPVIDRSTIPIRWTIAKKGVLCVLDGNNDEYFSVQFPEAPTGITSQFGHLQGYRLSTFTGSQP